MDVLAEAGCTRNKSCKLRHSDLCIVHGVYHRINLGEIDLLTGLLAHFDYPFSERHIRIGIIFVERLVGIEIKDTSIGLFYFIHIFNGRFKAVTDCRCYSCR